MTAISLVISHRAIAASAPIWQFSNLTDCELSYRVISDTLNQYSPICSSNVLQSWKAVYTIASGTGVNYQTTLISGS
jgi:hypothetical protein